MCCICHPAGGRDLHLSDLHLLNYDAVVTQNVLQPLSRLRSLSIFHLYSVPGPTCHLQTWLMSLPQLCSLTVYGESEHLLWLHLNSNRNVSFRLGHKRSDVTITLLCPIGGHPLAAYANYLPSSLLSLTLCVDLEPEDLQVVSLRVPHLEYLHLEPWSSSSNLVRLLPQLFPHLRTLHIRWELIFWLYFDSTVTQLHMYSLWLYYASNVTLPRPDWTFTHTGWRFAGFLSNLLFLW